MKRALTRRDVLRSAAGAAAAALLPTPTNVAAQEAAQRTGRPQRVIIIGAGLAGLVAAYELDRAGHNVTVLEARTRAGGRVYTLREPFSDGMYAEAGALFIPDNHELTMRYVRQFEIPLVPVPPRTIGSLYYVRDTRIDTRRESGIRWPYELTPEEQRLGPQGMWRRYISPVLPELGDPAAPGWPPESARKYDQMSMSDFLRSRGASVDAVTLMSLGYFDLWGDGVEASSALALLRDLAFREAEHRTYSIKGGNDLLPKAFASRLADRIRYGTPVVRIEHDQRTVRATYLQAGEPESVSGDHLICAIPFTTLRKIEVAPTFSAEKQRAVQELPYTSVVRVYLQARRRIWTEQGLPGSAVTDLPIMWTWEPTLTQAGTRGIVESYSAGEQARKVSAMSERERQAFALEHMEKLYPGLSKVYEGGASKSWDEDEWSRGDYAWFRPGQLTAFAPAIARPEGRIHFAGEHASAHPGWMQGALESGIRTVREITEAA